MTDEQRHRCNEIIDDAMMMALAAGAVSEIAVKAVQIKMVRDVAKVFDVPYSEAAATGLVNSLFSGNIVFTALKWAFPAARALTALQAADKTSDLGWSVAKDFDSYSKN